MLSSRVFKASAPLLCSFALLAAVACGDDDFDPSNGPDTDSGTSSGGSSSGGGSSGGSSGRDAGRDASDGDARSDAALDAALDANVDAALDADANVPRRGPAPVLLGGAGAYTILAESGITNVPASAITGDVGLSPAAATAITGFPLANQGTFFTTPEVTGRVFTVDNALPTPELLTVAVADMHLAYTDAASRPDPTATDLMGGAIGSQTLAPGLYKWNTAVSISTDVTLDGGPDDTWILQISNELLMSADTRVVLQNGAQAKNVVWQVAGAVTFGARAHGEGNVLGKTGVTLQTGASLVGRIYSQTATALDHGTVTQPSP